MISKSFMWSVVLLVFFTTAPSSVLAQGLNASFESLAVNEWTGTTVPATDVASSFRLKGTIVSQSRRAALINERLSREGDRVGGAEILVISEGAVRILVGSREYTVRVGSPTILEHGSDSQLAYSNLDSGNISVREGETLSEIAQRYVNGGATMNQMMIAMFKANPQAFGNNINVLRAGSIIRIPNLSEIHEQSAAAANAAVARQMDDWRTADYPGIQLAKNVESNTYGPVASGETLSGIAAKTSPDGVTMNQMMIALADANPAAFGGNINMLREGAILKIPAERELLRRSPELATAEVIRQTDEWRAAIGQSPGLVDADDQQSVPGRS